MKEDDEDTSVSIIMEDFILVMQLVRKQEASGN